MGLEITYMAFLRGIHVGRLKMNYGEEMTTRNWKTIERIGQNLN